MAGLWKAFVLVVASAVVFCEAHRPPRYEDIVTQALKFYNNGQQGKPLFRLLQATPPSGRTSNFKIPLNFRIKETVCTSTPERQPQDCAFKEDGEERNCTGEFFRRRFTRSLTLSCDRDCRREVTQVSSFADYPVADIPKEDDTTELPPAIKNIYENAKNDIINNILRNF
ncbi:neutrophilic granule protein-like [Nannospalax galili]|uniref:Neutrophilic granule protein n=1 Tax=Nannospalax galili TaxID=1026970 RepID=A0A8C6RPI3_NANGA|nr:neutrophilic granule protein-like [Nannospalax galili]